MIDELRALVISHIVEAERLSHIGKWKDADKEAWKAIYLMNAIEFRVLREKHKEVVMPIRISVEKVQHAIENHKENDFGEIANRVSEALQKITDWQREVA